MSPIFVGVSNVHASQTGRPVLRGRTGTDVQWIRGLVEYWRNDFDWRAEEARLNAFAQHKVRLDGIDLHFLHVEGEGLNPCPLLLSHGWPGSIFEFLKLIPMLTHPSQFGGDPAELIHGRGAIVTRIRPVIFAESAALRGGGNS